MYESYVKPSQNRFLLDFLHTFIEILRSISRSIDNSNSLLNRGKFDCLFLMVPLDIYCMTVCCIRGKPVFQSYKYTQIASPDSGASKYQAGENCIQTKTGQNHSSEAFIIPLNYPSHKTFNSTTFNQFTQEA